MTFLQFLQHYRGIPFVGHQIYNFRMSNRVNTEALMEKWQEIHGELDVFQKDLFVDHISIPKLQDFEMDEIEKALHITPKLSEALVLL